MATFIQPTGAGGQRRAIRRQARQVWSQLQPEVWDSLPAAQRWEVVRKVLLYVVRHEIEQLP